jgi:hypothetical protein
MDSKLLLIITLILANVQYSTSNMNLKYVEEVITGFINSEKVKNFLNFSECKLEELLSGKNTECMKNITEILLPTDIEKPNSKAIANIKSIKQLLASDNFYEIGVELGNAVSNLNENKNLKTMNGVGDCEMAMVLILTKITEVVYHIVHGEIGDFIDSFKILITEIIQLPGNCL